MFLSLEYKNTPKWITISLCYGTVSIGLVPGTPGSTDITTIPKSSNPLQMRITKRQRNRRAVDDPAVFFDQLEGTTFYGRNVKDEEKERETLPSARWSKVTAARRKPTAARAQHSDVRGAVRSAVERPSALCGKLTRSMCSMWSIFLEARASDSPDGSVLLTPPQPPAISRSSHVFRIPIALIFRCSYVRTPSCR